jgi:hypothetical protein
MTIPAPSTMAGQSATAIVDPSVEAAYWRDNYLKRGYIDRERPYSDYEPAFRHGWESRSRADGQPFRDLEGALEQGWDAARRESTLTWTQARYAVSDAWHRAGRPAAVEAAG